MKQTPMKQQVKQIKSDLALDASHVSEDELSEEDDQWALVLMRVYRAKVPINKSNLPTDPISARREA
jgi:hypothetical protein